MSIHDLVVEATDWQRSIPWWRAVLARSDHFGEPNCAELNVTRAWRGGSEPVRTTTARCRGSAPDPRGTPSRLLWVLLSPRAATLCDEITKLKVDLKPAKLIVLPVAKSETPETTAVFHQVVASDFANRDQAEVGAMFAVVDVLRRKRGR